MEEIEPDGLGEKYDNRNNGNARTGNNERCISNSLLPIRWKTTSCPCFIDNSFNNFVKLLYH